MSCSLSQRKAGQSTLILLKGPQDTGKATGQHMLAVGCMNGCQQQLGRHQHRGNQRRSAVGKLVTERLLCCRSSRRWTRCCRRSTRTPGRSRPSPTAASTSTASCPRSWACQRCGVTLAFLRLTMPFQDSFGGLVNSTYSCVADSGALFKHFEGVECRSLPLHCG